MKIPKDFKGLPYEIRIQSQKYKITFNDKPVISNSNGTLSECYGVCNKANKTIELTTNHESKNMTDVLLHELIHAIFCEYNIPDKTHEEQVAENLGKALFNLFHDKPKPVKYLNEKWKTF